MQKIKSIFWSGIKAFVPIVVTLAIVFWIFSGIEALFGHFLKYIIPSQYYFDGLGVIVGVILIFLLGLLVQSWFVRHLYAMGDKIVKRIPVIKTIYNAVQELLNFFDKTQEKAQQAVMIETPLGKMVGFVTRDDLDKLSPPLSDKEAVLVYIPFSYLMGGISVIIARKDITPLDWSIHQAISFIITAGMTGQKDKLTDQNTEK